MISKPLITHFETYLPFTADEKQLIESRVTHRKVKRREHIMKTGDICRHYTFVVKGILRLYVTDADGKEHNILFAGANEWIYDIKSFHDTSPGVSNIQAIESAEIIEIAQQDLYFLYNNIQKLNQIFKVITEEKYVELQNRVFHTISSTAQERYLSFLKHYPKLANRLPNTQIASYLGITPEFLSMVRKEMLQRK
nr:Crp/Fnr family transcriptional regulator [Allomuricauda sp.]